MQMRKWGEHSPRHVAAFPCGDVCVCLCLLLAQFKFNRLSKKVHRHKANPQWLWGSYRLGQPPGWERIQELKQALELSRECDAWGWPCPLSVRSRSPMSQLVARWLLNSARVNRPSLGWAQTDNCFLERGKQFETLGSIRETAKPASAVCGRGFSPHAVQRHTTSDS